jgi:hypothetical protein
MAIAQRIGGQARRGAQRGPVGGEGVSQPPLKDKVFLTFLGQNLQFQLRRKLPLLVQSFTESVVAHPSAGANAMSGIPAARWRR